MTQSWRRNQFPHIWDFPTAAMGQHSASVTRHRHSKLWNLDILWTNKYVCVYLCVFIKEKGWDGQRELTRTSPENMPVFFFFLGKLGKRALTKSCLAKTNKWVSQSRENILELIDASSPCICDYFHCQGPLQRLSHRLATVTLAAIMLIFIVQGCFF